MSIREKIAGWIAGKPKTGNSPRPAAVTDYDGRRSTRFAGQKFSSGLPNPAPTLLLDHEQIRQNVRTLSHQSLQLRALIRGDTDTVIGNGLNMSPEPKHRLLGLDPEAAKDWITNVKTRFELWAMSDRASRSGRYNFFQAQRLMRQSLYRDGELFVALSYHNDSALLSPLRFEILDPDQIRENGLTLTASGQALWPQNRDGITHNEDGEETRYKVWKKDRNGLPVMTEIPRVGRSGRLLMLHAITGQDYAGQLRGISPLAVCVQDLENILSFTLAQVDKAITQSNIAFTVESESDEDARDPLAGLASIGGLPGQGAAAGMFGNDPAPPPDAENVTGESLEPVYTPVPHTEVKTPGGIGIFSLKSKQKLKPFPATAPADAFDVFVDAYFSYIAASTGWSIETVLKKFNNNYSASRATLILTWRAAEQLRWELDYYVLGPIYEMWLAEEIAAGRVSAPGWSDPRLRAAWVSHRYNGLSQPNIDPTKTAAAAKEYLSMGATTFEDVAIEYNDSDAESNRVKLKQELAELREIGAMPWNGSAGSAPTVNNLRTLFPQQFDLWLW
jgi:lambda family phage portal protein